MIILMRAPFLEYLMHELGRQLGRFSFFALVIVVCWLFGCLLEVIRAILWSAPAWVLWVVGASWFVLLVLCCIANAQIRRRADNLMMNVRESLVILKEYE